MTKREFEKGDEVASEEEPLDRVRSHESGRYAVHEPIVLTKQSGA